MKFLIDANLPYSLIEIFKKHNFEAVHVKDIPSLLKDEEIFEYANANKYIVITKDLGFAKEFVEKKGYGLLLIRLPFYLTSIITNKIIEEFLKDINSNELVNSITVLELGKYRIRKI